MSTLADRLRAARERTGLSQVQVKHRTGINNKTLSGYENGVSEPDSENLSKLADTYGVTVDSLLGRKTKESVALPESVYDNIIREAEEHYKVSLRDDPVVETAVREIILSLAKMKQGNQ